jgi:hypothetical protein
MDRNMIDALDRAGGGRGGRAPSAAACAAASNWQNAATTSCEDVAVSVFAPDVVAAAGNEEA